MASRPAGRVRPYGRDLAHSTFEQQLQFIQYELTRGKEQRAGRALAGQGDARGAASVIDRMYERSADVFNQSILRGNTAAQLASGDQQGGGVMISQKTDIHVTGSGDPQKTAQEVARTQGWVNGNLVRNTEANLI
jgi:hypothetical protein